MGRYLGELSQLSQMGLRSAMIRFPDNLRGFGFIFDLEHLALVDELPIPNQARLLLQLWREDSERFPFVVAAGLLVKNAGVAGGLATSWDDALLLARMAMAQLDELACGAGSDFTSAWFPCLTEARKAQFTRMLAEVQGTVGTA